MRLPDFLYFSANILVIFGKIFIILWKYLSFKVNFGYFLHFCHFARNILLFSLKFCFLIEFWLFDSIFSIFI